MSKQKLIHHTAMPVGWEPKPSKNHYSFLDWCVKLQEWQQYIKNFNFKKT